MPRIRNIKPDFFDDEGLSTVSPYARLCFIGLWTQADREGRLEDRPSRLKARLFPFEPKVNVQALVDELVSEGCVVRYAVNGSKLLFIPRFTKHQYLSRREPDSSLPGIDQVKTSTVPVLDESYTSPTDMDQDIGHRTEDKDTDIVADATALVVTTTKPEALMDAWNEYTTRLPKATKLTKERRHHATARLADEPALCIWRNAIVRLDASDFACGVGGGWRADFDFLLQPGSLVKILEGKYDNRPKPMMGAGKTAGNMAALETVLNRNRGENVDRDGKGSVLQGLIPARRNDG